MTDDGRITLVIEGLPEDEGMVRLGAFMGQLNALSAAISKLDRDANGGKNANYLRISEISYSSPLRVVLEPHAIRSTATAASALLIDSLGRVAEALKDDQRADDIDAEILESIRALVRPVGKSVRSAVLAFNGIDLDLTKQIEQRVDRALAIDEECTGSIEGMLEQINIHQGANTFRLYPEIGPSKVNCRFPSSLIDDAVDGVGKQVEVFGTLRFRMGDKFPYQIAVSRIDVFPPDHEIPDWDDLRGLAPNSTRGVSSEDFIRELRDAW